MQTAFRTTRRFHAHLERSLVAWPQRIRESAYSALDWLDRIDDIRDKQVTTFVRDDLYPVTEPPPRADPTHSSTQSIRGIPRD